MAYATADELAVLLGIGPVMPADKVARADLLLELATGEIDTEVHQSLADATDTVTLDGTGTRRLVLPRWPVTAITSVTLLYDDQPDEVLTEGEDYRWSQDGILRRACGWWPKGTANIEAVVRAGYTVYPGAVRGVCLGLAKRAWPNPSAVASESIGDYSVTYGPLGAELTDREIRMLGYYRAKA